MRYWHIRLSSQRRKALFPDEASRRKGARAIARVGGSRLVQFSIADDHVHVEVVCEAHELPALRSALARAVAPLAADELAPSFAVEVRSRSHLRRNVPYFLKQSRHHGLSEHPALDAGCCFQDLVGARCLPGFDPRILKQALPRLSRRDLLDTVGLPPSALEPLQASPLRRAGVHRIVDAASAALGIGPTLSGRFQEVALARRAAARIVEDAGLSRRDLRDVLGVTARTIRRLAREAIDPRVTEAVRLRLSLEEAVLRSSMKAASGFP